MVSETKQKTNYGTTWYTTQKKQSPVDLNNQTIETGDTGKMPEDPFFN